MNNFFVLLGSMVSSKNCDKSRNKGKVKRALVMAALASCGLRAGKVSATPRNSPRITRAGSSRVEEGSATAASSSSIAAMTHEDPQLNQVLTRIKEMKDEELMLRFQPDPHESAYYKVNTSLIEETLRSAGENYKDDVAQAMIHRCFASNDSPSLVPAALNLVKDVECDIPRAVVGIIQAELAEPTQLPEVRGKGRLPEWQLVMWAFIVLGRDREFDVLGRDSEERAANSLMKYALAAPGTALAYKMGCILLSSRQGVASLIPDAIATTQAPLRQKLEVLTALCYTAQQSGGYYCTDSLQETTFQLSLELVSSDRDLELDDQKYRGLHDVILLNITPQTSERLKAKLNSDLQTLEVQCDSAMQVMLDKPGDQDAAQEWLRLSHKETAVKAVLKRRPNAPPTLAGMPVYFAEMKDAVQRQFEERPEVSALIIGMLDDGIRDPRRTQSTLYDILTAYEGIDSIYPDEA